VLAVPIGGGAVTTLAPTPARSPSTQAGPFAGEVERMPVGGGAITTLFCEAQQANIGAIALDATSVYFAVEGAVMKMAK
jgi:hypothetical protein